ncbi:MAG: TatD family deoxyribonuclease [Lachnospiraceae bacterium]|nr:TatD family deoxyribonuclease [Lachnospiraceae bacterium]
MIFDTHAHYDDEAFDEDRDAVLSSLHEKGVGTVVNICASPASLKRILSLTENYSFVYGAAGIHPDHAGELTEEMFGEISRLADEEKIVAIGEIGLDYYWDTAPHEVQRQWFLRQLDLAMEKDLPVVIHSREATQETLEIMREAYKKSGGKLRGVIHCFSGSAEIAKEYTDMGFYIGVGGVVTFKNGKKLKEVVETMPLDKLVIETDCPYLAPVPYRGKRNDSTLLRHVIEEIAALRGMTAEEVEHLTETNARQLYRLH